MSKRHTVTAEDFDHHRFEAELASGRNRNDIRKTLKIVFHSAAYPHEFHYEVAEHELGYERYYTIEDAVRRYNEL